MRRLLAYILIVVLAVVPCGGANASLLLAEKQQSNAIEGSHAHVAASAAHEHHGGSSVDEGHHQDAPADCIISCEPDAAQVVRFADVLQMPDVETVQYFVSLASRHIYPIAAAVRLRRQHWDSAGAFDSVSVLARTQRLRN